jgi:hypothetical protein
MFCALEANDDDPLTIDPETNMPEPPSHDELGCPPQLSPNTSPDTIHLCKDQFVYIPDTDVAGCDMRGPINVKLELRDCSGQLPDCSNVLVVDASQGELFDCQGNLVTSGTILISGIYVDGICGDAAGGQYILTPSDGVGLTWDVKYWEQSAIVNITTRLTGQVPLLNSTEAAVKRAAAAKDAKEENKDLAPTEIPSKSVALDVVWRFKVDLTPASSGTGGDGHHKSDGKPHGWSYPENISDDRQRKSIPRDEALKLMKSVERITDPSTSA